MVGTRLAMPNQPDRYYSRPSHGFIPYLRTGRLVLLFAAQSRISKRLELVTQEVDGQNRCSQCEPREEHRPWGDFHVGLPVAEERAKRWHRSSHWRGCAGSWRLSRKSTLVGNKSTWPGTSHPARAIRANESRTRQIERRSSGRAAVGRGGCQLGTSIGWRCLAACGNGISTGAVSPVYLRIGANGGTPRIPLRRPPPPPMLPAS